MISLTRENELLRQNIQEFQNRMASKERRAQSQVAGDSRDSKKISIEQAISELHSIAKIGESQNANSVEVTSQNKYLPIEQVEVYEQRYNELSKKYLKVCEEMQEYKAQAIGEGELIKERDIRIQKLNHELSELRGRVWNSLNFINLDAHKTLDDQYSIVVADRDALKEEWDVKSSELESVTGKLFVMNKSRNLLQIEIQNIQKTVSEYKSLIKSTKHDLEEAKHNNENSEDKIVKLVQEKEDLISKLNISERHYDEAQKQYEERIASINEIAIQNKKKKEKWASNYENEQRAHTATMEELVKTQTKLKETEMQLSSLKISTKAMKKLSADNDQRNSEINNQMIKIAIENDKTSREAATMKKLLEITKEECNKQISDLQKKISVEEDRLRIEEKLVDMARVDAESIAMRWMEKYQKLFAQNTDNLEIIRVMNRQLTNLKEELSQLNWVIGEEQIFKEEIEMQLSEYKELFYQWDKENKKMEIDLQEADKNYRKIDRESKKKEKRIQELKGFQERWKKAEKRVQELLTKMNIVNIDVAIQMKPSYESQAVNTDLEMSKMSQQEYDNIKVKKELLDTKKELSELTHQYNKLEEEWRKRATTGLQSHPDSARRLSPKYKKDLSGIIIGGKTIEHVEDISQTDEKVTELLILGRRECV
jgi:hypothetical protein